MLRVLPRWVHIPKFSEAPSGKAINRNHEVREVQKWHGLPLYNGKQYFAFELTDPFANCLHWARVNKYVLSIKRQKRQKS